MPLEEPELAIVADPAPSELRTKPQQRRLRGLAPGSLPSLAELVQEGFLPADAELQCRLYGKVHTARIRDGQIELQGQLYSPSAAAGLLRAGKASNGWVIWQYKGETLAILRDRLLASRSQG
jgi:hypothetical protein